MNGINNVVLLKEAYEYWDKNKEKAFEKWVSLLDDNISFESLANGASGLDFTHSCSSKQGVLEYFEHLAEQWEMVFYKVDEYIAEGDKVVVLADCCWRYRKTGQEVHSPKADIFTFKNGKIHGFKEFYDTAKFIACTKDNLHFSKQHQELRHTQPHS